MTTKSIESVWDYPRPPRLEAFKGVVKVIGGGMTIAESTNSFRVLETSHPPVYYIPKEDIAMTYLEKTSKTSYCEYKGKATYWNLKINCTVIHEAAWSYELPVPVYRAITGYLAFYAEKVDACYVDDEKVKPQDGNFYGGWITSHIKGPFKGAPGTEGW
ncbi:MAG: DUF427 domain-containing protein [Bacillota bacterium]|nr:DUF427 domain-containing protein [Bacillota bacterium]MDW7678158.1 DUF427 domain-containing protein [Bacillota bacterium]